MDMKNIKIENIVVEDFNSIVQKYNGEIIILHVLKYDNEGNEIVTAEVLYRSCDVGFMNDVIADLLDENNFDSDDVYECDLTHDLENPKLVNAFYMSCKEGVS